ncbi:unnamed protein product, partial [Mesorhabditis belari]|uniref:Uncharacterized protein n=1 Tax=Mesorhabditis belari TaxID=2138241 RepID=A0AAF3FKU5_9BILA
MATELDRVMQDLALEREKCQRLSLENGQLKQELAALRKEKLELENEYDMEMLNLKMPDDCLPGLVADKLEGQRITCPSCVEPDGTQILRNLRICEDHLKAKHNKELLDMSNEELESAIKNEAFCTHCFQNSHRMCKGEMPNLLDLKKLFKGRKMLEYLEALNAEGRVGKMTARKSVAVRKEDLIAKVKQMMKADVKTSDVDASVTQLAKKIQDFTKTVLDFEKNIDSVCMKMVEIRTMPSFAWQDTRHLMEMVEHRNRMLGFSIFVNK